MPLYPAHEQGWLKALLYIDALRLRCVARAGVDATVNVDAEIARATTAAGGTLDEDAAEFFADETARAQDLRAAIADMTMVATYHWVERQTKLFAKRLAKSKGDVTDVTRLDARRLAEFFTGYGVTLAHAVHAAEVNVLRLFANSWKHNADEASVPFLEELGLGQHALGLRSSLSEATIGAAIVRRLALPAGADDYRIIEKAADLSSRYLLDLAGLLP